MFPLDNCLEIQCCVKCRLGVELQRWYLPTRLQVTGLSFCQRRSVSCTRSFALSDLNFNWLLDEDSTALCGNNFPSVALWEP